MRALLLLLAGLLISPAASASDAPLGPFAVRTNHPLLLLHLDLVPGRAEVVPSGTVVLFAHASWSNLLERKRDVAGLDDELDLDMGLGRFVLGSRVSLIDGIDLGLEVPLVHFNAGFLDSMVSGYHRAVGLPNGVRALVEDRRFSYVVAPADGAAYDMQPQALALAGVTVDVRGRLLRGDRTRPTLSLRGALKLPTGSAAAGTDSGRPDLGLWLLGEYRVRRLWIYGAGGLLLRGPGGPLEQLVVPVVWTWMLAGELRVARSLAIVVQLGGSSPWYRGLDLMEGRGGVLDLTLGVAGRKGPWTWHVGLTEDPISQTPSVDFTAFVSVSRALGAR